MKVCIVCFSGRRCGNCGAIAQALRDWLSDACDVNVFDFSALSISPCGRCGYECFDARERCPHFSDPAYAIYDTVTHSDLTFFVVPNYNDFPCANFFTFNERGQCYFQHHPELERQYLSVKKKFVVVSNTGQEHFVSAFRDHVSNEAQPDVLFLRAKDYGKISLRGDLLEAQQARDDLYRFLQA